MIQNELRPQLARFQFTLEMEQDITMPQYSGSMLRGAFGHALKKISCMTDMPSCESCPLQQTCHYTAIFEPSPKLGDRYASLPAPFIIEAPFLPCECSIKVGQTIKFGMILFGHSMQLFQSIVLAWQRAAFQGLGRQRARARLILVEQENEHGFSTIFSEHSALINPLLAPKKLEVSQELTQISLVFLTPTRVKHNGVYCNGQSITAETLLNALRRKVDLYNTHYLHLDIASPPRPSHIQLKGELKVTPWSRYSSRQKQGIQLDGLLGKVTLEGDLQPWANLLALGEYTHIGKNTSFGLGQFQLERQGL